ncbi:uncharacterized protein isoform X2 [Leptinotarsa decemlineata]|uniref:uncharacterized protein isoform X2 n=1 Tax=Leptinotarsa decemlineata TaxID=7539 RepID=UPI003D30585D
MKLLISEESATNLIPANSASSPRLMLNDTSCPCTEMNLRLRSTLQWLTKTLKKKEKLSQIRRDGNFSAFKEGENFVPARVSKYFDKPDKSQYIACTCCKIIVKKDSLRKHLQKNCTKNPSNSSKGMLFKSRAISENIHKRANEVVKYFLFLAFRDGPIEEIIRFDNLIILYGNEMACKYRSQHHYPMIRNRMIRMARVLSMIKEKNSSVRHFEVILKPQMFDYIIEVINTLGDYDENTGNYNKPSLPTEVGTSLKYMIQLHISECIKNGDMEGKKDSKNLLHLLKTALPAHVNKTASESLLKHKRKKLSILPSMEDIKKLNSYVMTKRNHYYEALMKKFNVNTWRNLANFTLINILIFNRRRPGELERSIISDLDSLARIEENTDTYKKLSGNDKIYVREYVRFVVRGKLARGVPVLLHNSMHECVKLLLKYRKEAGIDDKNPYIFALPHRSVTNEKVVYRHVSATSLMRQYSEECGATNSKSLRATILRKHVATKSMSLKLDNEDLHLLQGYLGHAEKIHREYYRQPVLERDIISVSKVFLAAQCSPTSGNDSDACRSTPMSLPTAHVPGTSAISSTPTTPLYYSPTPGPSKITRITTMENESGLECNSSCDGSNFSDDSDSGKVPDGKRRRLIAFTPGQAAVKRTWNTPERQAARKLFSRHLLEGTLP